MNKKIRFHKTFERNFTKRIAPNPTLSKKFKERLFIFKIHRKDSILRDHALKGKKTGKRAFSITGDIRVVYIEFEDYYLFMDIGTHNQVY